MSDRSLKGIGITGIFLITFVVGFVFAFAFGIAFGSLLGLPNGGFLSGITLGIISGLYTGIAGVVVFYLWKHIPRRMQWFAVAALIVLGLFPGLEGLEAIAAIGAIMTLLGVGKGR